MRSVLKNLKISKKHQQNYCQITKEKFPKSSRVKSPSNRRKVTGVTPVLNENSTYVLHAQLRDRSNVTINYLRFVLDGGETMFPFPTTLRSKFTSGAG